jgi:hypothetical protein
MRADVAPPLATNMNAAFKKVRGAIGGPDDDLRDLIVERIVELAKDGSTTSKSFRAERFAASSRKRSRPTPLSILHDGRAQPTEVAAS